MIDPAEPGFDGVDGLLAAARAGLDRLTPAAAAEAVAAGARLVDIRPAWQRADEGEIPGALIVERNHLEWRLHPSSAARLPQAGAEQPWIVVCSEGYTSSLAAASLRSIGIPATDLIGGVRSWFADGLPRQHGVTRDERVVGAEPPIEPAADLGGPIRDGGSEH